MTPTPMPSISSTSRVRSRCSVWKSGLAGMSSALRAAHLEALHGDVVAQARHDELAVARLAGAVHDEPVAIQDALVAHAEAPDLQEVVGARVEHRGIHRVAAEHVLDGEHGAAGGHAPHEGKPRLFQQADAAGGVGHQLDGPLGGQRHEVLLDAVGGAEGEGPRELRPRGRAAFRREVFADEGEDFGLPGGQFVHGENIITYPFPHASPLKGSDPFRARTCPISERKAMAYNPTLMRAPNDDKLRSPAATERSP